MDSNHQPAAYKTDALTIALHPLSTGKGTWTPDAGIRNPMLYSNWATPAYTPRDSNPQAFWFVINCSIRWAKGVDGSLSRTADAVVWLYVQKVATYSLKDTRTLPRWLPTD